MKRKVYFETIPAIIINFIFGFFTLVEFLILDWQSSPWLRFSQKFMIISTSIFVLVEVVFIAYNSGRYRGEDYEKATHRDSGF